jgi:ABC-2 type transport system permease protein
MTRYIRLLVVQLRASALLLTRYRVDFFVNALMALFWTATAVIPLVVLYSDRATVAGWTWPQALLVVGLFTALKGVLNGAIQPALQAVVDHVRKGTLDFVLLKPADAQFLISTSGLELWMGSDVIGGPALIGYALHKAAVTPSAAAWLLCGVQVGCALAILYAIWIMVVSLAFHFVKVDNLSFLFASIFDAARWPASVFHGVFAWLFTFVIPLALMTTYPALALLGRLDGAHVAASLAAAAVFLCAARLVWRLSIYRYPGAGG